MISAFSYPRYMPPRYGEDRPDAVLVNTLLFLLGLFCFWEVRLLGALTLTELVLFCFAFFYLKDLPHLLSGKIARAVVVLLALWLGSQVLTDFYRSTPFRDWSRGWGKIIIWSANFSVFYHWLQVNSRRALWLLWGIAGGLTIAAVLRMEYYTAILLWKFGLALPSLFACGLLFTRWPRSPLYGVALIGLSMIGMALSFRSYSGLCLVTAALWIVWLFVSRKERPFIVKKTSWWLAGTSVAVLLVGVFFYSLLALNNVFGPEQRFRTEQQMRRGIGLLGSHPMAEPVGLIAGARSEFLVALRAISDSPVLGHGSWAKNPFYTDLWMSLAGESKITEVRLAEVEAMEPGLIPSHSHILGAWVDAGLMGGVFWGYAIGLSYVMLALVFCTRQPLTPLLLPVYTLFLWDIFFSPLSTQSRMLSALYVAMAAVLIERHLAKLAVTPRPEVAAPRMSAGGASVTTTPFENRRSG
jgi:hypothetical protein